MIEEVNPFALEIVYNGIFLKGKKGYFKKVEKSFRSASQKFGLARLLDGWRIRPKEGEHGL